MAAIPERLSLYKRNGIYSVLYYSGGKRHWKSTGVGTKPEALTKLTEFRGLLPKRAQYVPLSKFTADFLEYAEANYRPGTVALYRHTLTRFRHLVGDIGLTEVTAEHFDKFKSKRLTVKTEGKKNPKPRSVVSVNVELGTLKAAFNAAKRWGLIDSNPFTECALCPVPERAAPFFTPPDFDKLVNSIREGWLREVVLFAVLTGLRRGEILSLTWHQVNFERRLITIECGPTFKTKGGKRCIVPLNDTAVHLLKSRRGISLSEFVFTLSDRQIPEDWLCHRFKRYVRDAGQDERLHFHSLRHSFASWLVQSGATLYQVQQLLGHSCSSVTQIYSHLQPDQMHETVNKISVSMN